MIKPAYVIIAILIAAFIVVLLVMRSAGSVEPVEAQDDTSTLSAPTPILAAAQATPPLDGRSILEDHCANCHEVQRLLTIKKTRLAWEKTLEEMNQAGARLSDAEKDALLNYLEVIE